MEPRKRKILKHNNERWEVDFGIDSTGLKKRKVFATETDADKEIDAYNKAVKTRGDWWARLTELERESVQTVCKQVQAAGFTLSRVWEDRHPDAHQGFLEWLEIDRQEIARIRGKSK